MSGKLGLFSPNGHILVKKDGRHGTEMFRGTFAAAFIVILLPIIFATFVGASRIHDFAHARPDVNGGIMVGVFSAALGYYCNWPGLSDKYSYVCRPLQYEIIKTRALKTGTAHFP